MEIKKGGNQYADVGKQVQGKPPIQGTVEVQKLDPQTQWIKPETELKPQEKLELKNTATKELELGAEEKIKQAQLDKVVEKLEDYHADLEGKPHDPASELEEIKQILKDTFGIDQNTLDDLMKHPDSEKMLQEIIGKLNQAGQSVKDVYVDMARVLIGGPNEKGRLELHKEDGGGC